MVPSQPAEGVLHIPLHHLPAIWGSTPAKTEAKFNSQLHSKIFHPPPKFSISGECGHCHLSRPIPVTPLQFSGKAFQTFA